MRGSGETDEKHIKSSLGCWVDRTMSYFHTAVITTVIESFLQ